MASVSSNRISSLHAEVPTVENWQSLGRPSYFIKAGGRMVRSGCSVWVTMVGMRLLMLVDYRGGIMAGAVAGPIRSAAKGVTAMESLIWMIPAAGSQLCW